MKTFLFVFVVLVFSSLENYFGSRTTNGRVKTNPSVSLRWKKKDFNISKEVYIFLIIVHSICELICVQYFVFFRRAELKPICLLLLVVTVSNFTCPDLFILSSVKEPYVILRHASEQTCALKNCSEQKASKLTREEKTTSIISSVLLLK